MIDQTGEAIGLSVVKTIAGRTNTTGSKRRQPQDPTGFGKILILVYKLILTLHCRIKN